MFRISTGSSGGSSQPFVWTGTFAKGEFLSKFNSLNFKFAAIDEQLHSRQIVQKAKRGSLFVKNFSFRFWFCEKFVSEPTEIFKIGDFRFRTS